MQEKMFITIILKLKIFLFDNSIMRKRTNEKEQPKHDECKWNEKQENNNEETKFEPLETRDIDSY